jgi:hypothetical protein
MLLYKLVHTGSPYVLAARKRLHDKNLVSFADPVAEAITVMNEIIVDEDVDMLAKASMFVNHITGKTRVTRFQRSDNLRGGAARNRDTVFQSGEEAFEMAGKSNARHGGFPWVNL